MLSHDELVFKSCCRKVHLVITVKKARDVFLEISLVSSLICSANQWTGFYMIGTSVMNELKSFGLFFIGVRFTYV